MVKFNLLRFWILIYLSWKKELHVEPTRSVKWEDRVDDNNDTPEEELEDE